MAGMKVLHDCEVLEKGQFFDRYYVPDSVEALYLSGWKEYLLFHIRKYSLHDVNCSEEDILQDMMLQMIRFRFLENFDPGVTDFIKYLCTFVRNFMSKLVHREYGTKNGGKIVNHFSIVESSNSEDLPDGAVSFDSVDSSVESFEGLVDLAVSIESDLAGIKAASSVEYNGVRLDRDPLTVYRLLRAGYQVKEIAEIMDTSKQFVYGLRKKILSVVGAYC